MGPSGLGHNGFSLAVFARVSYGQAVKLATEGHRGSQPTEYTYIAPKYQDTYSLKKNPLIEVLLTIVSETEISIVP